MPLCTNIIIIASPTRQMLASGGALAHITYNNPGTITDSSLESQLLHHFFVLLRSELCSLLLRKPRLVAYCPVLGYEFSALRLEEAAELPAHVQPVLRALTNEGVQWGLPRLRGNVKGKERYFQDAPVLYSLHRGLHAMERKVYVVG